MPDQVVTLKGRLRWIQTEMSDNITIQTTYHTIPPEQPAADPNSLWDQFGPDLIDELPALPPWDTTLSPIPPAMPRAVEHEMVIQSDDDFDEEIVRANQSLPPLRLLESESGEEGNKEEMGHDGEEVEEGENEEEVDEEEAEEMEHDDADPETEAWSPEQPTDGFRLVAQYVEGKPANEESSNPEPGDDGCYEVEMICAMAAKRVGRGFQIKLNVKWEGWSFDENTWEPAKEIPVTAYPEGVEEMKQRAAAAFSAPKRKAAAVGGSTKRLRP